MLFVLILSALANVVCSYKWALDSHIEDELTGIVKRFNSRAVSIFG